MKTAHQTLWNIACAGVAWAWQRRPVAVTLLVLAAALLVAFLAGCAKKPAELPSIDRAQVVSELAPRFVTMDDEKYSPIDHAWLERALAKHVAHTWHDREYAPELKDCDDFTDYMVSRIRKQFGEQAAPGSGGALIGRYTVQYDATSAHRVAIVRTERGWFVADPQTLTAPPRTIPLVSLAAYNRKAYSAAF